MNVGARAFPPLLVAILCVGILLLGMLHLGACSREATRPDDGAGSAHRAEPPMLLVRLSATGGAEVRAVLAGAFRLSPVDEPGEVIHEGRATGTLLVRRSGDGLEVNGIAVDEPAVRVDAGPIAIGVGERTYRGALVVRHDPDGGVVAILEVDLESYVAGVVAGEMPASFPAEALRAQAVAARTYALDRRASRVGEDWHLHDDTRSQMFVGLPSGPHAERFESAARTTRGVVLLYESRVFTAYYHSTCGGSTAGAVEVFGGPGIPPLGGVPCGTCEAAPRRRWEVRVPAAALDAAGFGSSPRRIAVGSATTSSGRAKDLLFERGDQAWWVRAADLRAGLRSPALPSTWIEEVAAVRGGFLFRGRGHGHGVGLCQYGAAGRAIRGWSADDILRDYYPGATVSRIY